MKQIALLRGINVGGKNLLAMTDLAACFRDAGCLEVRTYIQSGNVLFSAPAELAATLPEAIPALILERFGIRPPVILRSLEELRTTLAENPFLRAGQDPDSLHVMFLAAAPTQVQVQALDPERSPGDQFAVRGRDIYLRLPHGAARTRLSNAWFDARLDTISTSRNWKTAARLAQLAQGGG